MTVASPCTGICKLDEATGWCLGCGRTGAEIAEWQSQPELWRDHVWEQIPARLSQLGVACRRLPWTSHDIREFVVQSLQDGRGTWVMGVVGAVAEFTAPPGAGVGVSLQCEEVVARTCGGAMRMMINDDVRAVTFDPPGQKDRPRIVLAVKRERGRFPVAGGVADIGEDRDALSAEPGGRRFDLGLGRKEARFCVRVGSGPATAALESASGLPFEHALAYIAPALLSESPTRVVETSLGRIEVQGQIPAPDAVSPEGPHTHLLPDHLATGRALPVGMDLPRAYLPGAVYYPPRR